MTRAHRKAAPKVSLAEAVTAENYCERARAHIRANGQGVVVVSPNAPQPLPQHILAHAPDGAKWRAWMLYLASRHVPCRYAKMVGFMTVPADWPELFDPSAPQSDPFPPPLTAKPQRAWGTYGDV